MTTNCNIFTEIRTKYNILSPIQKEIADFILNNSEEVIMLSISDLAQKCNTSETTIMRFLRKLGYSSYQVFRVKVAQELSDDSPKSIYEEIKPEDNISEIRKKVILSTVNSINDLNNILDDKSIEEVVDLICKSKRIYFLGVGASGIIANDAFHKFLRLGLNVITCNDSHIMNIMSAHTNSSDLLVIFSHSGESQEVLECAQLAKENGTKIVTITSYGHSTITKHADIVLLSSTNETKYRSDAMVSRIIQLVIIDILYVAVVLKLGPSYIKKVNKSRLAVAKRKI
ncbi:MurR/RpiR family transcriptional regulator [Caloramator sp. E03]|uniref:MurR/RpiR family transcriptional regulator n=1 Tax=Caloramator sp. E03 TaxID=2576307 RepID=UPI001110AACC|nr:MurR/RpiR family transcriptional regulator [Caloramator sp. E03]QCX34096.1 MurR/RpiR family transcriptional regulator [Caloramator sp. E03]